jgi:hypothetical protein
LITKSRIVGLLVVLGVGLLVFRSEDEPADSNGGGSNSAPATEREFQPREPAFLTPGKDFGIANRLDYQQAPLPSYAGSSSYLPKPHTQSYSGEYGAARALGGQAPIGSSGYRFRPLNKQEQRRMQESHADQYREPRYSNHAEREQPVAPAPYGISPTSPDRQKQVYTFRPLEDSSASRGRWQGPYQRPGWHDGRPPLDPWTAPPNPQWGSTPPAHRMYPSYSRDISRRFAGR